MTEPNEETTVVETGEVQTVAVSTPAVAEPADADLGKVRELVLKAHPDVVPDLVRGGSVDELIASVEPARGAYQRIAEQVRGRTESGDGSRKSEELTSDPAVVQPPAVPAGGATNVAEPADLGPTTKIAQALAARKRQ
jgi:hypothetical protein